MIDTAKTCADLKGCLTAVAIGLSLATGAAADIGSVRIAAGLSQPLFVTQAPGDDDRLFIVEKTGDVRIFDFATKAVQAGSFLTVTDLTTNSERGLLGLAFHPDFANNGRLFVNHTDASGDTNVVEYTVDSATGAADPSSRNVLLEIPQPQANHNGGWIGFGPDGFLYVATGDGGGGNDDDAGHTPGIGNAQDTTNNLLGKMLRIDVDGDDFPADPTRDYAIPADNPFVGVTADDEIWAYGLRNPFRASFDRQTGDLWIGDVGQNAREEVNFQEAGFGGGANYGWRLREGSIATPSGGVGGPRPADNVDPIYDYQHGFGTFEGRSVTGGYVYRGVGDELPGLYVFADFVSNRVWSLERLAGGGVDVNDLTSRLAPSVGVLASIASFGEDNAGNLYIANLGGSVYRVIDSTCPGDATGDGLLNADDLLVVLGEFGSTDAIGPAEGDVDGSLDRAVNADDLLAVLAAFGSGCP